MLRPVVPVGVLGVREIAPRVGLVDTGAEHVLADAWLAESAGIDVQAGDDSLTIGIGGQIVDVTFTEVELRLHAAHDADQFVSWRADVGFVPGWRAPFPFVLGQVGFLDRFTTTFHRGAGLLAIEDWEVFDSRFGTGPAR